MGFWERLHRALGRDSGVGDRIKEVKLSPRLAESRIQFGDRVRILPSAETGQRGFAGKIGEVYGQTTPSVTNPAVIGPLINDYAVNVFFEDLGEQHWFAEQLLELIDHNPGSMVRLDGVNKEWVREADGSWTEKQL